MTGRKIRGILVGDLVKYLGHVRKVTGYGIGKFFVKPPGESNRSGQWVDEDKVSAFTLEDEGERLSA